MEKLKELRLSQQIPAKDMVEVVRRLYPKYDKTVQSKCENGDVYGVMIRPDAMNALYDAFALEPPAPPKKDKRRLTCRISARLETADYERLQQLIKADGYKTMQDWIADVVRERIRKAGETDEQNS